MILLSQNLASSPLATALLLLAVTLQLCPKSCLAQQTTSKKLIVHIDDAGLCHSANQATIECLESGASTSASVMMPCAWAPAFAAYAKEHPEYCYGVHFTLNCEWKGYRWAPVAGRDKVPSLVDEQGYMWGSVAQVAEHAKAEEVEIELRAQIELARTLEIPISHFDTHMGSVMARPDLVQVYTKLALEYEKPILWLKGLTREEAQEYPHFAGAIAEVNPKLEKKKIPMLDHLLQFYGDDNLVSREKTYRDAISSLKPGVSQLIIHASVDGEELAAITTSHLRRNQDYELFSTVEMRHWIEQQGVELTNWKKLTDELRK